MEKTELFSRVKEAARRQRSLYGGTSFERERLLDFLEMNEWFGQKVAGPSGDLPKAWEELYVTEEQAEILLGQLGLWLAGFRRKNSEKLDILAGYGQSILPRTVSFYREFIREEGLENNKASWMLLDFLLYHLTVEIMEIDSEDAGQLADLLDREATRAVSRLYSHFNNQVQEKFGIKGWRYRYEQRRKRLREAYSPRQFSIMAYCVFNEEYWKEQNLVEKACGFAHYANLWAFIAMHFVCGLRSTDIIRIPKPDLQDTPESFMRKAMEGTLEAPELISRDIQIRYRCRPQRPNKTKEHSYIPDLKVFIPTSLEKAMGIILGIAAAHCGDIKPGEPFLHRDTDATRAGSFFGSAFRDALDGKGFATSRANKAYLQGMEATADAGGGGGVRGYMTAALARSHKGRAGAPPDVTETYLKDAAFAGYKPEFIAREMFERGVFGFVPHLLLEVYAGRDYASFSVPNQTLLIREMGISPSGIENLVSMCETSLTRARSTISDLLAAKVNIASLLQEIATGRAVGKQDGCLCVMTGSGFTCPFPERSACIGCRYEVHTKSIIHLLKDEYLRMCRLADGPDGWRYEAILKTVVLPIIHEYLISAKTLFPDDDFKALKDFLRGGLPGN